MTDDTLHPKHHSIPAPTSQNEDTLDLIVYWRSINKRKWNILGLGIATAVLAAVIVNMMTPVYRSTATLLVEQNKARVVSIEDVYGGGLQTKEHFQTQSEIIKSTKVATLVADKLKIPPPDANPEGSSFLSSALSLVGIGGQAVEPDSYKKRIVEHIMRSTNVEPVRMSQLIKVSYDSPDRQFSAMMANLVAQTYIENDMDARFEMTKSASDWLNSRMAGLKEKLEKSEQALQEYREREHIVDTKNLELSGAGAQLEGLLKSLVEARMRRSDAENAFNQVKRAKGDLDSLPVVQRNPLVTRLKEVVADNERKVSELANRYGPEHVKMVQATAELKQAKANLRQQVDEVVSVLAREYEVARANETALEDAVAETKDVIQKSNNKGFALSALERDVVTNRQIYDMFLNRFKETSIASDMQSNVVARVVDPAIVADTPVRPKKLLVILFSFFLGLFIGAIVALLLERLDNTIKSTEDAEAKLGQPILTTIPLLEDKLGKNASRHYLDEPKSIFSEGIRTARTGILLSAIDCPNKVIVVTSSIPGEGKSTFSINLALAHAQTKKVLLIDADMRRPTVTQTLGLNATQPGLSALVAGTASLQECVQTMEGSSLNIIGVGVIPPNPLELLLSAKFKEVLDELSREFDIVILDSPPVQLVSDAVVLSTMATGVIFVVKADSTSYQISRRCIRTLLAAEATLFGVAINQLDFKKADRYYGANTGYQSNGYDGYYAKPS